MTWQTSLPAVKDVVKDVVLTSLGVVAIWSQIFSLKPNGYVLGAGLALTVPTIAGHVRGLLPGPGDGGSSPSTPPPQQPPPPKSQQGASGGR